MKKNFFRFNSYKDEESQTIEVRDTAINEYFDIVKNEYEIERNKKQSFENRAGLILALLGAVGIFLFEHIDLKEVIILVTKSLNFLELMRIVLGFSIYISFLFTMVMIIKTITVKQHHNFEVKNIDEELIMEERTSSLIRLIFTYRDIIIQHRELNEIRAKTFRKSLYGICVTLITVIIYISL